MLRLVRSVHAVRALVLLRLHALEIANGFFFRARLLLRAGHFLFAIFVHFQAAIVIVLVVDVEFLATIALVPSDVISQVAVVIFSSRILLFSDEIL